MIVIYEEIKKMTVDEMVMFLKKFERDAFLAGRISAEESRPIPDFDMRDEVMRKWLTTPCVYSYFTDKEWVEK